MKRRMISLALIFLIVLSTFSILAPYLAQAESSEPPATEWDRTYGGTEEDHPLSVIQTNDGGYALAGRTNSFRAGGYDFWLVKTNSTARVILVSFL